MSLALLSAQGLTHGVLQEGRASRQGVLGTRVARWRRVWYRPDWFGQRRFMVRCSNSEMGQNPTNALQHVGPEDRRKFQAPQVPVVNHRR
jgi:hypothetical protein